MSKTTEVRIYTRHSAKCPHKHKGADFEGCRCRKWLRWSRNNVQYRRNAQTRSWGKAEEKKRELEAEFNGPTPQAEAVQPLTAAIEVFLQDKQNQDITPKVIGKYTRELARLREFCEARGLFNVRDLNRELLTHFCATWLEFYPASSTRSKVRERLRSFLRYCWQNEWGLTRIPELSKIKVDQTPTLPLTPEEYKRLLDTTYATFADNPTLRQKVHALIRLMRFTGLAIADATTLERSEIIHDKEKDVYRVVTARQKTGVPVSVVIPPDVAAEILEVLNSNPRFVFWSGEGLSESVPKLFNKHLLTLFKDAGLNTDCYAKSHRLRDTFACDLLSHGVPLQEVSRLLGHTSIKTTEKSYGPWVKSRQDRADSLVMATWAK